MEIRRPMGTPLCKGEATCHSSWLYSFMHRRYVEAYYKVHCLHMMRMVENTLLVAEGICVFDLEIGHNILLVFGLITL